MAERIPEASPRLEARLAGACYPITFVAGTFPAFAAGALTACREAANLIASAASVALKLLFYDPFEPVKGGAAPAS